MTFNMLWNNKDYGAIAQLIDKTSPDIIGLQEVRPNTMPILVEQFKSQYPYHTYHPVDEYHNVGLLSRFPIEEVAVFPDPPFKRGLKATLRVNRDGLANRKNGEATSKKMGNSLLTDGSHLQVIVAHLTPNYPFDQASVLAKQWYGDRAAQAAFLNDQFMQRQMPMLVLCDCNLTPASQAYEQIQKVWTDSFQEVGWGFGHTLRGPVFPTGRLDYVWHTPELRAVDARVIDGGGSDHMPLVVRLQLPHR